MMEEKEVEEIVKNLPEGCGMKGRKKIPRKSAQNVGQKSGKKSALFKLKNGFFS